jgi:hypothetical protein
MRRGERVSRDGDPCAMMTAVHAESTKEHRVGRDEAGDEDEALGSILGERFAVLTGYRPPGSRSPFGHVVLGATGVFVVQPFDDEGSLRVRGEDVTLDGEPLDPLVQRVRRQAFALQLLLADALSALDVRVAPVLWVRSARLGLRRAAAGVRLTSTRDLRRLIGNGRALVPPDEVRRLSSLARARLVPVRGLSA